MVRESHLDFLYDLYKQEIDIGAENIALLKKNKYIAEEVFQIPTKEEKGDVIRKESLRISTDKQRKNDEAIDIVTEEGDVLFEGREKEITKKDWLPKSTTEHTKEFIEWIDSMINLGFGKRLSYKPLTLYIQQANTWLSEKGSYLDYYNEFEKEEYIMEELRRCDVNTLYFLNKYVYYKEGDSETGKFKYHGTGAHEVMVYLNDCGYSMAIAKGRQIAATTTLMACDVKDMIFKPNHFMKFITEDQEKAEEIFEDKLKYAFSELPYWMKPNVLNERDNFFKLGNKEEKGDKGGVNSTIRVVPPKRTSIAGGAPQKVKIDEAGNIGLLTVMINNARPTMYMYDPGTGKMTLRRQLIFWGTGGEMEKGGMAFQTEFLALIKEWKERKFHSGIIPIFFDWTARPGATQEIYEIEKAVAYSKEGLDLKKSIIEFHQSWPRTISDVFMTSEKTLVDLQYIDGQIDRIRVAVATHSFQLHTRGYFEPIYDETVHADENSDVPFKIIGSTFVPTGDNDERSCVTIFSHPKHGWKNRYFQGTDPIASDTGQSNMSTTIYDKHFKTLAAIMDFRTKDYRYVFLQNMLCGLYYDTSDAKEGIKELVECNIGQSYTQYKEGKGYGRHMTLNYELPPYLQNKTTINDGVGIDNRGLRNVAIVNKLHELIQAYGDRIYHEIFFEQLKTFVCEVSDKGKEMWGPANRKHFKDDVLFSATFAYICAELCYPELIPEDVQQKSKEIKIRYETQYDANFNLRRVAVRKINR